ncbi:MAG: hypothetical protein IKL33_04235, partial [Alphaproteobacteria bacterium]|nr:hypothetical protein [Alphaproteobacteria bacterium]
MTNIKNIINSLVLAGVLICTPLFVYDAQAEDDNCETNYNTCVNDIKPCKDLKEDQKRICEETNKRINAGCLKQHEACEKKAIDKKSRKTKVERKAEIQEAKETRADNKQQNKDFKNYSRNIDKANKAEDDIAKYCSGPKKNEDKCNKAKANLKNAIKDIDVHEQEKAKDGTSSSNSSDSVIIDAVNKVVKKNDAAPEKNLTLDKALDKARKN